MRLKRKATEFTSSKRPASQGTPPNSPAAVSAFSRVVAASQTNKQAQNQVQGNALGLAAVLLQGAQGKPGGESGPRGKHGRIDLGTVLKRTETFLSSVTLPYQGLCYTVSHQNKVNVC
ncbi:hypothetical protein K0M31_005103 [Melipona bicolor]|uniref:Uncharacterized protein n=1 Tax=Melipona bicolor TaxID=60889 RepID=A0AA40FW40_9HYME|nr:hypothetical protein K0M31_005103 [Melipona bicolor]